MTEALSPKPFIDEPELLGPPNLNAFRSYMVTAKHPRITDEEMEVWGTAIQQGREAAELLANTEELDEDNSSILEQAIEEGRAARRLIAGRHLGLVVGLSRKFSYREGVYDEELRAEMIAVGNVALMEGAKRYTFMPNASFAAYATSWILRAMVAEKIVSVREATGVTRHWQKIWYEIDTTYQEAILTNPNASFIEIGEGLGYTLDQIITALTKKGPHVSLATMAPWQESGLTVEDKLGDPKAQEALEASETRAVYDHIWQVAKELRRWQIIRDAEWTVFVGRFRDGRTRPSIAEDLEKVSEASGVAYIEKGVLAKIKKEMDNPGSYKERVITSPNMVEAAADLLCILEIPIKPTTNIIAVARNILDNIPITEWQRETMYALTGTNGKHFRPKEFANLKRCHHSNIYLTRDKAINRILHYWSNISAAEKAKAVRTQAEVPAILSNPGHLT